MSIGRKAIVGALWTSGANYIAMAAGFVVGIYRDRLLMPFDNGVYMYALALVDLIFIAASVSFNISLINAPEDKEDLHSTALVLTLGLAAGMLLLSGGAAWLLLRTGTMVIKIQAFAVLSGFSSLNLVTVLFTARLERRLEYKSIARVNLLSVLAFPVVSFLLVRLQWGAWAMVWGSCASFIVSFFGLFIVSRYPIGFRFHRGTARWFLSQGWKFVFSRGIEVVFVRYGTLVTERLLGTTLQGSFGRALKYWELAPQTVAPSVVTVALPVYAKLRNTGERLDRAFGIVVFLLVRVLLPFVLVFGVLPESFIRMLGPQWVDAVPVLRILAAATLLHPLFENMKQLLYALGTPERVLKIRVVQMTLFVPLMYVLVRWFGIQGAAMALVVNYTVGVTGTLLIVRRIVSISWLASFVVPLISGALASLLVLLLPLPPLGVGSILQFAVEVLYLVAAYAALEVLLEWRRIGTHVRFIRELLARPDGDNATSVMPS
jgi:O-antigen/teichoic acid export membrane protein